MKEKKNYAELAGDVVTIFSSALQDGQPVEGRIISAHEDIGITIVTNRFHKSIGPGWSDMEEDEELLCINREYEVNSLGGKGEEAYLAMFYNVIHQVVESKTVNFGQIPGIRAGSGVSLGRMVDCPFK